MIFSPRSGGRSRTGPWVKQTDGYQRVFAGWGDNEDDAAFDVGCPSTSPTPKPLNPTEIESAGQSPPNIETE